MNFRLARIVPLLALAAAPLHATNLTYTDLCARYTDMKQLAVLPDDGEIGGLASSYDRSSQYDASKDQYIKWSANGDGTGFVREEGNEQVLADIKGCGCIWRIWSADQTQGHVKIYLDGSASPVVDMPFADFTNPRKAPLGPWTNLNYMHAGETSNGPGNNYDPGGNNYIPIPFKTSCKIVGDKGTGKPDNSGWGKYFHFSYTLFPKGTTVPDFAWPLTGEETAALTKLNDALAPEPRAADLTAPGAGTRTSKVTLSPGQISTAFSAEGAGAIVNLKVKLALPEFAEPQRELLRQLTIRMTWDGDNKPAVWSPLGDFFGYIGGGGPFRTVPVGLGADGTFYSHWYMPFGKGAKIELGNDGPAPVTLELTATTAPLDLPPASLGRFHAKWHRDDFLITRPDRFPDWPMVLTQGRGRFVGTMLHVWNPHGGWWGEGDEKFFVDGEKFPSYFGTGTEDYFGYAWGGPGRWERAFHAQILNENNNGHLDNQRWLIADNVPFHTSFEGDIEKYFPNQPRPGRPYDPMALYATVAYWYLAPGGTDDYPEVPVDQRLGYWPWTASYNEPGAIEAESLELAKWTPNNIRLENTYGTANALRGTKAGLWSGDRQLAWDPENLRDQLALKLPVEKAGRYQIIVRPTKGPDYGIFQFGVDGQSLGSPIDLYAAALAPGDPVTLGTIDLTAGTHVLNINPTGKNPAITKGGPFAPLAFDYVKLVPAP